MMRKTAISFKARRRNKISEGLPLSKKKKLNFGIWDVASIIMVIIKIYLLDSQLSLHKLRMHFFFKIIWKINKFDSGWHLYYAYLQYGSCLLNLIGLFLIPEILQIPKIIIHNQIIPTGTRDQGKPRHINQSINQNENAREAIRRGRPRPYLTQEPRAWWQKRNERDGNNSTRPAKG